MRITQVCYALVSFVLALTTAASASAAPTISSFSPVSGTIGNHVVITGSGFTGATAVTFNGVSATTYTVNSATQITATVPNAASTGTIKVTTSAGTATSATSFTVTTGMALSITSGPPTAKPVLYGAGFSPMVAVDVYFDNVNVALFVSSATGTISTTYQIPVWAQPGQHWITFVTRYSGVSAQKAFTVQTNWAEEGFGPKGRGANPYENTIDVSNVGSLTAAWSGNSGSTSPYVMAGGSVFVANSIGQILAYSNTGALLWTASPGGNVTPVAALGRVFFGDNAGNVRSYSQTCRSDGGVCTPQWTTPNGSAVTAGLTYYNGTLYVPSGDGSIHTINPTTGALGTPFYAVDNSHGAVSTPIVFDSDGSYYYGAGTALESMLPSGPDLETYGGTISSIAINNGSAYFTSADGHINRYGDGAFWSMATSGSGCAAAPVVALGAVYAGGCSTLTAYSPKTGSVLWSVPTGSIQGISEANGVLYVCEFSNVQAYYAYNGAYLWSGGECGSAPEVANGNVFASFRYITAYDSPTAVGGSKLAPSISSLHPDYKLKPQLSGTAVVSGPAIDPNAE